jgi:hypothetical protein
VPGAACWLSSTLQNCTAIPPLLTNQYRPAVPRWGTTAVPGAPEGQAQHVVGEPVLVAVVPEAEDGGRQGQRGLERGEAKIQALLQ